MAASSPVCPAKTPGSTGRSREIRELADVPPAVPAQDRCWLPTRRKGRPWSTRFGESARVVARVRSEGRTCRGSSGCAGSSGTPGPAPCCPATSTGSSPATRYAGSRAVAGRPRHATASALDRHPMIGTTSGSCGLADPQRPQLRGSCADHGGRAADHRKSDEGRLAARVLFSLQALTRPSPASLRKKGPPGLTRTGRDGPSQPTNERVSAIAGAKRGGTAGFGSSSHRHKRHRSEEKDHHVVPEECPARGGGEP